MRVAALALILPMLAACTYAVIEKSKGEVVSPGRSGVTTRLVSASAMRPAGGAGDAHLYLCFGRSSAAGRSEKFFLVQLPERYPFADEARQGEPFRKLGNMLVLSAGTESDAVTDCDAPRGQTQIERIAILTAEPRQAVLLPVNMRDAIIVSYNESRDGLGLGSSRASATQVS